MICSKGQLVRLIPSLQALALSTNITPVWVLAIVYNERPEGERGVQLSAELGGSRWWLEDQLEEAT